MNDEDHLKKQRLAGWVIGVIGLAVIMIATDSVWVGLGVLLSLWGNNLERINR